MQNENGLPSNPKVLLVDDEPKNLLALETILSDLPVELVKCSSGEKALEKLMEAEFALVLMDVQMPGMDGFEAASLMRSNKHFRKIPIIFVTAISKEDRYVQKGHEIGAVDYLFKPVDPVILLSKVRVFLDYYVQEKKLQDLVAKLNVAQEKLENTNKELAVLARYDAVTGLANRLDFTEFLESELEKAKRSSSMLSLLFLDLDNFKNVNDTHGHQAGDELLKQVSSRLKEAVRSSDSVSRASQDGLVSRLGGDEFAIVLSSIRAEEDAARVARRITGEINKPFRLKDGLDVNVGVSIGIACYPLAGNSSEQLCKHADVAMYQAKKKGKNTYQYFSEELNVLNQRNLAIEDALREALCNKDFYLMYQPIVDLSSGETVAVEALCRCKHDALKEVSPSEFIKVAEKSGLIIDIGIWVFLEALDAVSELSSFGDKKIQVHINVSAKQFQTDEFYHLVAEACEKQGVDTGSIVIEVTETALMQDVKMLSEQFAKFNKLGIEISIDDFGTGYSSLTWLRNLPISSLKIDKEFIDEVSDNGNDAVITRSIIKLASNLELNSIAEGVETKEQLEFLKENKCPMGQGFYFSEPISLKKMIERLTNE
jgi:diguanylate cyclase (GGDEF)-like protein